MSHETRMLLALERAKFWLAVAEKGLPMKEEKPSRLVPDWRNSWRWASMQFNALAAILVGVGLSNIDIIASVLSMAPPEVRAFIPLPIALGLFMTVAVLRLWKQNK